MAGGRGAGKRAGEHEMVNRTGARREGGQGQGECSQLRREAGEGGWTVGALMNQFKCMR